MPEPGQAGPFLAAEGFCKFRGPLGDLMQMVFERLPFFRRLVFQTVRVTHGLRAACGDLD